MHHTDATRGKLPRQSLKAKRILDNDFDSLIENKQIATSLLEKINWDFNLNERHEDRLVPRKVIV